MATVSNYRERDPLFRRGKFYASLISWSLPVWTGLFWHSKILLHDGKQKIPKKKIMQGQEVKLVRDPFPFKIKVSAPWIKFTATVNIKPAFSQI